MIEETKEIKKLYKCYNKKLKAIHKHNLNMVENNLEYFVTYLCFLRDSFILNEKLEKDGNENIKISSIATAIEEYHQYKICETRYFKFINGEVKQLIEGTKEEVLKQYNEEKNFHWVSFWKLIASNIETWSGGEGIYAAI